MVIVVILASNPTNMLLRDGANCLKPNNDNITLGDVAKYELGTGLDL